MASLDDAGWDLTDDNAFTRFLDSLPARPRLLGLGEPMHGEEEFLRLRNRLFRHLVEHEGYQSIAIESDCLAGEIIDRFIGYGAGALEDVMRTGFSHGFGEMRANRELVEWMREHNRHRPPADRLRFYGFDAPLEMMFAASPRQALMALHDYLASNVDLPPGADGDTIGRLIGDDGRWTNPEVAMNPSLGIGATAEAVRLRLLADDLQALLAAQSPHLIRATSVQDYRRARLHARTATGLLRYHAGMTEPQSAGRVSRLLGLRDAMMADNLSAIVDTGHRTLAFAQNRHLQREESHWQLAGMALRWWSAGAIVSDRLGDGYAFVATALGAAPHYGLDAPAPDTIEGVLSTGARERYLINSKHIDKAIEGLTLRTDTSKTTTTSRSIPATCTRPMASRSSSG